MEGIPEIPASMIERMNQYQNTRGASFRSWSPDASYKGFLFSKDIGGNEFSQLFWFDIATGNYEMISDGGRSQNSLSTWSNKGDRFQQCGQDHEAAVYYTRSE